MTGLQINTDGNIFRWSVFTIGLIIMSLGAALMIRAELGSAPWDVLHIGLVQQFGLTVGTWTVIMGFLLLVGGFSADQDVPPGWSICQHGAGRGLCGYISLAS